MPKKDPICPFIGKPCIEHGCRMWVQVMGHNPNTGEQVNQWNCSLAWLPILMIENSQQQRQTGAAVESFRNEMVKGNQTTQLLMASAVKLKSLDYIEGN